MKHNLNLYLTGYLNDSMYQSAILQSMDLSRYDDVTFHTSGFSSLMCYMFLINKLHLYVPYMLRLSTDGVSKFYYYRRIILFLNRIPFGIGKYIILLIDMLSVLINAMKGYIYTVDDFVRLINYVDKSSDKSTKKIEKKILRKMNVHVYNITTNRSEIINGSHPLFKRYLLASLSRLTFFEPIKIQVMLNECRCTGECLNCNKHRQNKNSIFVTPEGHNICTCENSLHRYNEYVDCDLNGPFLIEEHERKESDNVMLTNLIMLSNCVKDQRVLVIRKTNFLARTMDLLKFTTQHKVDDIVDKICSSVSDQIQKTVCINYCTGNPMNNETDKQSNQNSAYSTYKDFNPAAICDLKRSFDDGVRMRKLIDNSLLNEEKDKIYIECTSE